MYPNAVVGTIAERTPDVLDHVTPTVRALPKLALLKRLLIFILLHCYSKIISSY